MMWRYSETGSGQTLVLLHGIGMSHAAWKPVIPYLCTTRRVIAFDIAGFGSTPPLPNGTAPNIANLVDGLERSLGEMGIELPVDIAGNSLGGSMAIEGARRGLARRAVAISPAGLWKRRGAAHVPYVFGALRFLTRKFPKLCRTTMRSALLREIALAVPMSVGSGRMPVEDGVRAVDDMAGSVAFEDTFHATLEPIAAREIAVPVTVAFGDCDWILTRGSRLRDGLPRHTRWLEMRGWGHVPMWTDPAGVARVILDGAG